ncbi:MAG: hypothetical protein R3B69_00960 [Candidatus Paceibacterota bacterium]
MLIVENPNQGLNWTATINHGKLRYWIWQKCTGAVTYIDVLIGHLHQKVLTASI